MNLRTLTVALVVLVPAAASAGPLQPGASLLSDPVTVGSTYYETPLTESSMGCSLCDVDAPAAKGGSSSPNFGPQFFYDAVFNQRGTTSSTFWYLALQHGSRGEQSSFSFPWQDNRPPTDSPQPVPEPSTLLLVGSSLAVAAIRKRRAGKKAQALATVDAR
jgi:hypothetical protein